jgi:hypothetical protein
VDAKQPGARVQRIWSGIKMVKESNGPPTDTKSYKDMSGRELLLKIMELTAAKEITDNELQEILESIERILSERKGPGKQ